jgi:hypothetical protein
MVASTHDEPHFDEADAREVPVVVFPISDEMVADAVQVDVTRLVLANLREAMSTDPKVVAVRRARIAARELEAEAAFMAQTQRHRELVARADLPSLARKVLELHAPDRGSLGVVCRGCEFEGDDAEPPAWPCSTWALVAENV